MSKINQYKDTLKSIMARPKKSLGQNFLVNEKGIAKIIEASSLEEAKQIVEVGPGLGALTEPLIQKIENSNQKLILIETDHKMTEFWKDRLADLTREKINKDCLEILKHDALKVDWDEILSDTTSILVSNLPYQISASLVILLSQLNFTFEKMVLMFQKEVAQRITSKPNQKSYGLLSVLAQQRWNCKKLIDLSSKSFYPPPKVDSRVIVFEAKPNSIQRPDLFSHFVKIGFAQRRKLLSQNLRKFHKNHQISDINRLDNYWTKEQTEFFLNQVDLDLNVRAENLTVEDFVELFEVFLRA